MNLSIRPLPLALIILAITFFVMANREETKAKPATNAAPATRLNPVFSRPSPQSAQEIIDGLREGRQARRRAEFGGKEILGNVVP